uniref:16S rRNA (uracil(1498)-N(3))-methyltransferase n=1 Tax=Alexandrium monilatum TaxID=311494 RepID=A0A7S4V2R1_9DINO
MRARPFVEDALDELCPPDMLRLLCHPDDVGTRVRDAVAAARDGGPQRAPPRGVLLAIGPEGGWVDFELELLRRRGFVQVSLGPRILSTDVALVALVTLAVDALAAPAPAADQDERSQGSALGAELSRGRAARAPVLWSASGGWALLAHVALGALCVLVGSSARRRACPPALGCG